jgi:polyferredoxin/uncharacterized protein with FMN-binding domain
MGKSKAKVNWAQVIRHLIQLAAFILMPDLFISTFGAIKDVYTAMIGGTFSFSALSYQLLLLLAVIPVTALMGRFFCGYFCAFGALGDLLWFISGKVRKKRPAAISESADRVLRLLKYGILGFIVLLIWTFGAVSFGSTFSPWTIFGMFASFSGWPSVSYLLTAGAGLLLLIMIGSLFVERFFCRYLCPLGAILSLISRLRVFHISKPHSACGSCSLCTKSCAMGLSLYRVDRVASGDCINCFQCVDACPRRNVKANPTPAVSAALASAAIAGLYYAGNLTANAVSSEQYSAASSITAQLSSPQSGEAAFTVTTANASSASAASSAASVSESAVSGLYEDGVYTGTGSGFRGTTTVSVTVSGGIITAVQVVSSQDDAKYMSRAKSAVISSVLTTQGIDVSTVSGATFSSNGILEAVADALSIDFTNPNSSLPHR